MSSTAQSQRQQGASVVQRVLSMTPEAYEQYASSQITGLQSINEKLVELVKDGTFDPIVATRTMACASAAVWGYDEFHQHDQQQSQQLLSQPLVGGIDRQR